jgi:hypothetical protein
MEYPNGLALPPSRLTFKDQLRFDVDCRANIAGAGTAGIKRDKT